MFVKRFGVGVSAGEGRQKRFRACEFVDGVVKMSGAAPVVGVEGVGMLLSSSMAEKRRFPGVERVFVFWTLRGV